jgi:hypothetical protein
MHGPKIDVIERERKILTFKVHLNKRRKTKWLCTNSRYQHYLNLRFPITNFVPFINSSCCICVRHIFSQLQASKCFRPCIALSSRREYVDQTSCSLQVISLMVFRDNCSNFMRVHSFFDGAPMHAFQFEPCLLVVPRSMTHCMNTETKELNLALHVIISDMHASPIRFSNAVFPKLPCKHWPGVRS